MKKFIGKQKYPILTLTVIAGADLEGCRAVTRVGAYAAAGASMHGVSATNAYTGDELAVDVMGTTICEAGGVIAADALLEVGTNGKFITRNTGKVVGRALEAAAGDGSAFEALLLPAHT
ncbi:capsid cement protein [Bowmanella dokdonensis]|uniref:DUF2190 family protein n=1 Tax=Bowmanella dokdonensis TaxID=751969 RepID=A0A939DM44_9ALTE|nr:capsid cement protein [Bowmanella dokdonensis]MBN7824772.1 DUF2190 family protein [Bowmanella dokdonensis]